jgi:hypothetical protein
VELYNIRFLGKTCDWFMVRSGQIKEQNQRYVEAPKFLGAFAKLREATLNFFISVGPSVRMEQLGSHWTDFYEI